MTAVRRKNDLPSELIAVIAYFSSQITEFHSLHRELVPYVAFVKTLDLPSNSKSIFSRSSNNKAALEKARVIVQRYLDSVLADDQLNQSEIVYSFLSPSPKHLKSPANKSSSGGSTSSNSVGHIVAP